MDGLFLLYILAIIFGEMLSAMFKNLEEGNDSDASAECQPGDLCQ